MPLKSTYKIYPSYNLIIEFHEGVADVNSYIAFKTRLFNDKDFRPGLNYFVHQKNVTYLIKHSEIKKFVDFLRTHSDSLGKRKIALVTNTPNQVVTSTIYKAMQSNLNQKAEIFSTNEAAINWLIPNSFSAEKLLDILKNLYDNINK